MQPQFLWTQPTCPRVLNLDKKGKSLTLHAALQEKFADIWKENSGEEIKRMIRLDVLAPKMPKQIPDDAEITYYNAKCNEKEKPDAGPDGIQRRVNGVIGGNLIYPHGPSSCQVTEADVAKMFMNAAISEMHKDSDTNLFCADIQDFYLHTPLDKPVFIRIHSRLTTPAAFKACDLERYIVDD